jgi:hypothetical protein
VLVTSFLPSGSLTQQILTKVLVYVTALFFLRGPGDYYLECLRKFGNAAGLWKMQVGPTYVYRPLNVQLISLQILQCLRSVAKRQQRPSYVHSVAMNDVEKKVIFIVAWTATDVSACP